MTPVLMKLRRPPMQASPELLLAASIVRDAAEALAVESQTSDESARCQLAADRLTAVLNLPRLDRLRLLQTSPALTDRSGNDQTLVEMIETEPDFDDRFRLAKLLFLALVWRPETFPEPRP